MKNFEQITETSEALGAFLASLPIANGPWDAEFRRTFCDTYTAENCDGPICPHNAERNNPLWWLTQAVELDHEPEQQPNGQENAVPGSKPGTVQGKSGIASAAAAWKVLQAMGYVNTTSFRETQDFLRKAQEILGILEQAGIDSACWKDVVAMAAAFDVHMRG